MTRITLDRATVELLHNPGEPLEFCDETGWLLGSFTPEVRELAPTAVSSDVAHRREVEASLGEEISIFGYEEDLE